MVSREIARLHFSYPVPPLGHLQSRIAGQMMLHLKFIQASIIEATEFWRHATERANERKQRRDHVCDEAELRPSSGLEITFGFRLQIVQRRSRCKAQRDQVNLAEGSEHQVAGLLSQIEPALINEDAAWMGRVQGRTW